MIRFISLLVSIPILILVAAFAYKNAQPVSLDLFSVQIDLPMSVIMLAMLLVGFLLGLVFNMLLLLKQRQKYMQMMNKKDTLQGLSGVLKKSDK